MLYIKHLISTVAITTSPHEIVMVLLLCLNHSLPLHALSSYNYSNRSVLDANVKISIFVLLCNINKVYKLYLNIDLLYFQKRYFSLASHYQSPHN